MKFWVIDDSWCDSCELEVISPSNFDGDRYECSMCGQRYEQPPENVVRYVTSDGGIFESIADVEAWGEPIGLSEGFSELV